MPTVPHAPTSSAAEHEQIVAALDADDLREPERTRAASLLRTCDGCAQLLADLAALRGATRALPAPPRTRDFRLTPADAERLRPTAARRLLGWLAGPRSTVRPLAGGLAALGVAGLLVAGLPGMLGSSASVPSRLTATQAMPFDRNAAGAASAAASMAEGGASYGSNDAAASAAASQAALGPATAPSPASFGVLSPAPSAAPSPAAAGPSAAQGVPSPAPSSVPPPSPLAPGASAGRTAVEATSSPVAAVNVGSPPPPTKSSTGSTAPNVPPGALTSLASEGPAGGLPLVPASALLLVAAVVLFGARLVARRLI